jgi:threonine/homoserine/homoserine lactone efflux protein
MIGTVLPLALVVGLSPLPILPAVVLLMTPRARANGPAYLAAWLVALTALVLVAVALGGLADPDEPTDEGIGWIQVATGAAFLVMAAVKWLTRPRPGAPKEPPTWLAALDTYTPRQSARLGALLASANPKNLVMALAAGAEIALLAEGTGQTAAGVAAFVAIGSMGVATPILAHAVLGDRATPALERGRAWLDRNSTALSVGVLVLLGALLLLKGIPSAV